MVPPCKVTICLQILKRVLLNTITERVGKRDDGGTERFSKLVSNVKNSDHLFICKGNFWAAYPKGQNTRNWRGRISVIVKKYR